MNAVGALGMSRSIATASLRLSVIALLFCTSAYGADSAADAADEILLAQAFTPSANNGPQMEMSATSVPRFDSGDGATRSSRIDMTLLPTRQSTLGPSLVMTSPDTRSFPGGRPLTGSLTSVDLGLHWRYTSDSKNRFDVSAWRRMNPVDAASLIENRESSYGARVEMHLAPVHRTGFVVDHGIGFQLESGARITLRKGGGGKPMIYYRSNF